MGEANYGEGAAKIIQPVEQLDFRFECKPAWVGIFDLHAELIQQDILRALAADRIVVYLSCPVSSRGGSFASTNVDVATATAHRLIGEWGDRFWFLNPAQYQLESNHGFGLIRRHAATLKMSTADIDALLKNSPPGGGDYMRMWTRVLAEDETGKNFGGRFSAYYFIGPSDYRQFFTNGGQLSLTDGIEAYFARKFTTNHEFNAFFSANQANWDPLRKEFLRYYATRASAAFSRGSRDEWNIWVKLNQRRLADSDPALGIGAQIAGYFDGRQIDPASAEVLTTAGYALPVQPERARSNTLYRVPPIAPTGTAISHLEAAARLCERKA
jgi:hypothetical protein